jgi:hypothetical protein
MIASFSREQEGEDGQNRRRYANPDTPITPVCKDFHAEVGITRRSA